MGEQHVRRMAATNPGLLKAKEAGSMQGEGLGNGAVERNPGEHDRNGTRLQRRRHVLVEVECPGVGSCPPLPVQPDQLVDDLEATEPYRR